jgi:hypothetical protein
LFEFAAVAGHPPMCTFVPYTQNAGACTFINELENNDPEFNIFPNPFNTSITILGNSTEKAEGTIVIYNALGSILFDSKLKGISIVINTDNLSQGVYFVKIQTKQGIKIKKVVKE